MKKRSIFIFVLLIILILGGCNSTAKNASNSLKITIEDEKIIQIYLDTKTDDLLKARDGKVYSAFTILGTDKNRIYVWVEKIECAKEGNLIVQQDGAASPLVLYIKDTNNGIAIKGHKGPEDGEGYGRSIMKLFPENVRNMINTDYNERAVKLVEEAKSRAEDDLEN